MNPKQTKSDYRELKSRVQNRLIAEIDPLLDVSRKDKTRQYVEELFNVIIAEESVVLTGSEKQHLFESIIGDILGYGPIEPLIADPNIREILVVRPDHIYIRTNDSLVLTDVTFEDENHFLRIVDRIVAPLGRRIDEVSPIVAARLPDGSRVQVIIRPIAVHGPTMTITKLENTPLVADDLVNNGTIPSSALAFLASAIHAGANIIVSGNSRAGKTTLLNVLAAYIPSNKRIVTIEHTAELQIPHPHVVPLETRLPNIEGRGAITTFDLVINTQRMVADYAIIGDLMGGEAFDVLFMMMNTGTGVMSAVNSNAPRDTLSQLEVMALMAGMDMPVRAIREQIASSIDLIVHIERLVDGTRRVTSITEIGGIEGSIITLNEIFRFEQERIHEGKIIGQLIPTRVIPTILNRFEDAGILLRTEVFEGIVSNNSLVSDLFTVVHGNVSHKVIRASAKEYNSIRRKLRSSVLQDFDWNDKRNHISRFIEKAISNLGLEERQLLSESEIQRLVIDVTEDIFGLSVLQPLLEDESIEAVFVVGPKQVFVRKDRVLLELDDDYHFDDEIHLLQVIDRIVAPMGRRIDESIPLVDVRLAGGTQVNIVIRPISLLGPVLSIKKHSRKAITAKDLLDSRILSGSALEFLRASVQAGINIIIAGAAQSGKTTLLSILANYIPSSERIITVENAAELKLQHPHVVALETRPANIEGRGMVSVRDLMSSITYMAPDRVIVGEVRSGEALDMVTAMRRGFSSVMATLVANNARDVISRLEVMCLMSGMDLPVRAIREQIAGGLDLVILMKRNRDGKFGIHSISEVQGVEGDLVTITGIFEYIGKNEGNPSISLQPTGIVPKCVETIKRLQIDLNEDLFNP